MIERRWARMKPGSDAEVDFLVQVGAEVVPVEVKAGATGSMKSLHRYLIEKQRDFGVRINGDRPSYVKTTYADETGTVHPFRLLSLPFYMCGQLKRLVQAVHDGDVPPFQP